MNKSITPFVQKTFYFCKLMLLIQKGSAKNAGQILQEYAFLSTSLFDIYETRIQSTSNVLAQKIAVASSRLQPPPTAPQLQEVVEGRPTITSGKSFLVS